MVFKTLHEKKSKRKVIYHSAGIRAIEGMHMDATMQRLLSQRGVHVGEHHSRRLSAAMVREADLVLAAERQQICKIEALEPTSRGKVFGLGNWEGVEINDPHGKDESLYHETLALIERVVASWIDRLC
jgi:protein-tyrosine phosphatase